MQPTRHIRTIANWLLLCAMLVALMVMVGGITRLTESGLSIVKWELVSGTLPPLNGTAWQKEFDDYKRTPQYQKVNSNFSLGDFKQIFWLEYIHRLIGRIIGLATIVPLIYFSARRQLPRPLVLRCVGIAVLIGAQGTVGWIMVASGLHGEPRVEPLKLALHLLLAFFAFALMLWTRWQVLGHKRFGVSKAFATLARFALMLLVMQIAFGALVAGLRAGLIYTTYPLMDGEFIPHGIHFMTPWWLNHVENALTVQFQHRMGALAVVATLTALVIRGWKVAALRPLLRMILITVFVQFCLGVSALLSHVEIALASGHQLVALVLVALLTRLIYRTSPTQNPQAE